MRFSALVAPFVLAFTGASVVSAGICQIGCNAMVITCYAGAGMTFGTVIAAAAAPPIIMGCNAAFGTCSAMCTTVSRLTGIL